MIDIRKAKEEFKKYVANFNSFDPLVNLKIIHTYGVIKTSNYIATSLNLSEEEVQLAELIGLLHDIGRFEETKQQNTFTNYTFNHAEFGVNLLFKDNLIRNYITSPKYDNIIYKAILNHSKIEIENGLSKDELLFSKIIRDADKLDNFRVKLEENLNSLFYMFSKEEIENSKISDLVYNTFLMKKTILNQDREEAADFWLSYIAFIFDYNFDSGLIYIYEHDLLNKMFNKITFKNTETASKMAELQIFSNKYLNEKLSNRI